MKEITQPISQMESKNKNKVDFLVAWNLNCFDCISVAPPSMERSHFEQSVRLITITNFEKKSRAIDLLGREYEAAATWK